MELIIKPTGRCNFDCKFCSAANMDISHPKDGSVQKQIKELIEASKPVNIIVTGGEPLMVGPNYYYELHDIGKCNISITSNLKDFYFNPDKWVPLFKETWFGVATSFNYGYTRMWDKNTVYNEEMFIKVMNLFEEKVGKKVQSFLSVIDENNEDTVIDHVLLAKRLGMTVKLNNAIAVGRQSISYPRYKMYQHYLRIMDEGLGEYECNCIDRFSGKCPKNTNLLCDVAIRSCYVDSNDKLHISICDESAGLGFEFNNIDDALKGNIGDQYNPEDINPDEFIKPECVYCELFRLCNGCMINRMEAKKFPEYCEEMKKLENRIIEYGWKV